MVKEILYGATHRRGAKRRYEAHFVGKLTDSASGSESLQLGEMPRIRKPIHGLILQRIAVTWTCQITTALQTNPKKSVQ